MASLIASIPSWLLFLLTLAIGLLASEAGAKLTPQKHKDRLNEKEESSSTLTGAMLGLMAFMLGFTFSITASRLGDRKKIVSDQANILITCYLRTHLIPEKQGTESRRLLSRYTDLLIESANLPDLNKNIIQLENYHLQVWNTAATLVNENMDGELRSLYISSVNEVIEIFNERKTIVLIFRIPATLWISLLLLYTLSMFVIGAGYSTPRSHRSVNLYITAIAFSMIVVLIAEMDTPAKMGRFTVNQQPLREVQQIIKNDSEQLKQ
jgi:hypothetical protein